MNCTSGTTEIPLIFLEPRLASTYKKQNCRLTGTHTSDGKYHATSLGRYSWRRLIGSDAFLQRNCNREGFNARTSVGYSKARIGIIANNENDCSSCNSRIGFGTGGSNDDSNTCGNEAIAAADNGDKHIKAMGYILVQ